jgi:hypothetical protein
MATISTTINTVEVKFNSGVVNDVTEKMTKGLEACIKKDVAKDRTLISINISSAKDSHDGKVSNHNDGRAVDINQINETRIAVGYPQGGETTDIVKAIQDAFEEYADKRENFGPHIKKKEGKNWTVDDHDDHIHLSVNA